MNILPTVYRDSVRFFEQSFLPQLTAQQKIIAAIALAAFSCFAAYYVVSHYCFKAEEVDPLKDKVIPKIEVIKKQQDSSEIKEKDKVDDKKVDAKQRKDLSIEEPKDIPLIEKETKVDYQNGIETFSFEVLQKVINQSPNDNRLISPLGISFLLSMIKHGVGQKEREEIERILHLPQNDDVLKVNAFTLIKKLQKTGFDLAGLVYLNPKYRLNHDYQKLVSQYYQSKVQEGESVDDINQWVKEITNDQIQKILEPEDLVEFAVVLANAIHFKADWVKSFNADDTYPSDFTAPTQKVEVQMMHKTDQVGYFEDDKCQAIKLNYRDKEDVFLMLILPKNNNDFSSVDETTFCAIISGMENTMVKIALPKFKIEQEIDVKEMLAEMGMDYLFRQPADFSALIDYSHYVPPEGLEISKIKQKSALECDEKGTEASMVTVAVISKCGSCFMPPEHNKEIKFDRPFLAALMTKEAPVMFSVVRDPST